MTSKEIIKAKDILGLPEKASKKEIKACYTTLIKKWHPDRWTEDQKIVTYNEMTAKINAAYKIIQTYCDEYQYSFREQEIRSYMSREEWWFERFGSDPLWGPGSKR